MKVTRKHYEDLLDPRKIDEMQKHMPEKVIIRRFSIPEDPEPRHAHIILDYTYLDKMVAVPVRILPEYSPISVSEAREQIARRALELGRRFIESGLDHDRTMRVDLYWPTG